MDYSKATDSVADTISKASNPLTEAQKMLMAGAMTVWLEKATTEERVACELRCAKTSVLIDGHHEYTALKVQEMMMCAVSMRSNVKLRGAL